MDLFDAKKGVLHEIIQCKVNNCIISADFY